MTMFEKEAFMVKDEAGLLMMCEHFNCVAGGPLLIYAGNELKLLVDGELYPIRWDMLIALCRDVNKINTNKSVFLAPMGNVVFVVHAVIEQAKPE